MKNYNLKQFGIDILVDIIGGIFIAVGLYNFALNANFPVAGFSGIAIILYHLIDLPIGVGTILLNIPVAILCYKFLGKSFFLKSIKTIIISSILIDYIAPLFPAYDGSRLLAAICMGVCCGAGYAIIFMRGSSTGGQDFITMSLKKIYPHLSIGFITFSLDIITIIIGSILVFKDIDGFIYGVIVTYLMAIVMNKIMYGIDEGKMTLVITEHGQNVAKQIEKYAGRGSTIIQGRGSYSGLPKDIVICACNNKQMYSIKKIVREIDPKAFTIIVESNEVVGEGFKEDIN